LLTGAFASGRQTAQKDTIRPVRLAVTPTISQISAKETLVAESQPDDSPATPIQNAPPPDPKPQFKPWRLVIVAAFIIVAVIAGLIMDHRRHQAEIRGPSIADLTKAIARNPNDEAAYRDRGFAKLIKDDYDGAIADLTKAIELKPNDNIAYSNRAAAKMGKKDFDGALADTNKAKALEPKMNEANVYTNRGLTKRDKGDLDGAIAEFNKAIELDPNYSDYYTRGQLKQAKGDLDGAFADYTATIELQPDFWSSYKCRAEVRKAQGDKAGAKADLRKANSFKGEQLVDYFFPVLAVASCFLVFFLIFAPREIKWAPLSENGKGRAERIVEGIVVWFSLAAQAIVWIFTGKWELWGVAPVLLSGLYFICAFSLRGARLWILHRRNQTSPS
jgi:tetratricopeptide (TPR) repeat protein